MGNKDKGNCGRIDNLVICSTLNQITNYLIIKKFKPKRIFNITFNEDTVKLMNINMKNNDWDMYLKEEYEKYYAKENFTHNINDNINIISDWNDIKLGKGELYEISDIKNKLNSIIEKIKDEEIYWHITGGQRLITLAISKFIENRENDKLLYIEGNSEKILIYNSKNKLLSKKELKEIENSINICNLDQYGDDKLTLETALKLVGFNYKTKNNTENQKSIEKIFKNRDIFIFQKTNNRTDYFKEEHKFYLNLWGIINGKIVFDNIDDLKTKFKDNFRDATPILRNLLLQSNHIARQKDQKELLKFLFKNNNIKNKFEQCNFAIEDNEILNNKNPFGHMFEKIVAHKIYEVISKENDKFNIVEMRMNFRTYFNEYSESTKGVKAIDFDIRDYDFSTQKDEIDIILLTNTGKVINFECKSGGMDSNNAKSTKYTTYRLSGVFGMPILMSPLYISEVTSFNDIYYKKTKRETNNTLKGMEKFGIDDQISDFDYRLLSNCYSALRAAQAAELKVITIDKIEEEVEALLKNLNLCNDDE